MQANAQDLRALREAGDSFKSSVFKLQLDEVLREVTLEDRYSEQARKLLFQVRETLAQESGSSKNASSATRSPLIPFTEGEGESFNESSLRDSVQPDPQNAKSVSKKSGKKTRREPQSQTADAGDESQSLYKEYSAKPVSIDSINVIGSWSLHTAVRKRSRALGIDLLVAMPADLFEPRDYCDYRYTRKAACYLAVLADKLAKSKLPVSVSYERFANNEHEVTLLLVPEGKLGRKVNFHVHVGPEKPVFPLKKLVNWRSNIHTEVAPTPHYNWTVAKAQLHTPFLKVLHEAAARCTGFVDAVRLGSLWLQQRGYTSSRERGGGFGAFEFSLLLAALLQPPKPRLPAGLSSYQLFRAVILFLAEEEFQLSAKFTDADPNLRAPKTQPEDVSDSSEQSTIPLMQKKPELLFNGFDVLANIAPWAGPSLKRDAQLSITLLNDPSRDRFSELFLQSPDNARAAFDVHFDIHLAAPQNPVDVVDKLSSILARAWGARARSLRIDIGEISWSLWPLTSSPPGLEVTRARVYANLDPELASKRLTFVGPEFSNSVEEFRDFWGSKASLRRFGSGEIREAVLWHAQKQLTVVEECAAYAVYRHLGARVAPDDFSCERLTSLLPHHSTGPSSAATTFAPFSTSFQNLQTMLLDSRDVLPLRLHAVLGLSSAFRYASVSIPQPFDSAYIHDAVLVVERSSRWPRDPEASAKVQTAFCVRLADHFRSESKGYHAVVSLESSVPGSGRTGVERPALNVQTPEGFYFRLFIDPANEDQPLAEHTRAVSVHALRHPAFSRGVRLFKLWLDRQMLGGYINEQMAELLAIDVFVNSAPYSPPATPSTAFFRILSRLARFDFREDFVFVDFDLRSEANGAKPNSKTEKSAICTGCSTPDEEFQRVVTAIEAQRKQDPALTQAPLLLATNSDPAGVQWSSWEPRSRIAAVVAARLISLAQVALVAEKSRTSLFTASGKDFDISFSVEFNAKRSAPSAYKNIAVSDPQRALTQPRGIPQELVASLQELYKDSLVLFYDGLWTNASEIRLCGIWNRLVQTPKRLKPNLAYPVTKTLELDKDAVIAEIERLGGGMIKRL